MSEFFRKLGVSYSEIDNRYSPLMTNLSGPEAVWAMFHMSGWAVGYTGVNMLARASYSIAAPIQVDENNPKLFKVTIRNLSDRRFKVGSESTIEYFKHDLDVLSPMRLVGIHKTLPELIAKINSTAKVQLSLSDFDVENCINDDGMWHLVASEESYFFVKDSFVKFNDRTSWPKIVDWLPNEDLGRLVKQTPSPGETNWDRTILESNLVRINKTLVPSKQIDLKRLLLNTPTKSDGRTSIVMDRIGLDTLIGPAEFKYDRLPIGSFFSVPQSIEIPWATIQMQINKGEYLFTTPNEKEVWFRYTSNTGTAIVNKIVDEVISVHSFYGNHACGFLEIGVGDNSNIKFNSTHTVVNGTYPMALFVGNTRIVNLPIGDNEIQVIVENGNVEYSINGIVDRLIPLDGRTTIGFGDKNRNGGQNTSLYIMDLVISEGKSDRISPEFTEGTIHGQLDLINDHYGTKFSEDDIEDGIIEAELEKSVTLVAKPGRYSFEEGSEYRIIRARDMSTVFQNKDLTGFEGYEHKGPGNQYSKVGYEYPDGRHTRYLGRVSDTELFTPQEVADTFIAPPGTNITVHYPTTEWFKYELDGDIVYIPMKPLFGGLTYNQLKAANVVNRSGDHLAKVPANTKGNYKAGVHPFYRNKVITKDGRAYAVRMIKGANIDGPLPFTTGLSDDVTTHDSEWNRMMYNLTETTILPVNVGDSHASQRGPKWDSNSAANMVVENNGANLRYTYCPELTLEGNVPKGIYRGCYGVSIRGRQGNGIDALEAVMGFRPMLKLLPKLQTKTKLAINDIGGFKVVDFHLDTDLDYCHDVEVMVKYPGKDYFTKMPYSIAIDGIYLLLEEKHIGCKFKFRHTDTLHTYESEVLDITEALVGDSLDYSMNGPGPKVPKRIRNSDEVEDLQIMYFGRVTKEEFFSSGELRTAVGLTDGMEMDCVGWFKFSYCGDICYVPERPITHTVNMNQLRDAGLRSGKVFTHEGQEYSTRVLRGTRFHEVVKFSTVDNQGDPITHRQTYAFGSEWNELYYRLSDVSTTSYVHAITNDTYPVHTDSQFELMTYDDLLMANNQDPGTFNLVYEDYGQDSVNGAMYRGTYGLSRFSHANGGAVNASSKFAFRPIVYLGRGALKSTSTTESFAPIAGTWKTATNSLKVPNRNIYNGFTYGDQTYLMYGDNSPTEHTSLERVGHSDAYFNVDVSPPSYRYGATVTRVGDLFYIIGGRKKLNELVFDRDILVFDPNKKTYTKVGTFDVNISFHSATVINGVIYIIGGHDEIGGSQHGPNTGFNKKYFYTYDTVTGQITNLSNLEGLMTKYRHRAHLYKGKIYLFAGNYGDPTFIDVLDIATLTFSRVDNPLHGLTYGYTLSNIPNQSGRYMYVISGWAAINNARTNQCFEIDLETMTSRALPNLPQAKTGIEPVFLFGKLKVFAGWNGSGATPLYNLGDGYDLVEEGRVDVK